MNEFARRIQPALTRITLAIGGFTTFWSLGLVFLTMVRNVWVPYSGSFGEPSPLDQFMPILFSIIPLGVIISVALTSATLIVYVIVIQSDLEDIKKKLK